MSMRKHLQRLALVAVATCGQVLCAGAAQPPAGSCEETAVDLGNLKRIGSGTKEFSLVPAVSYMNEAKTVWVTDPTNLVYYFKVRLSREKKVGNAYSLWLTEKGGDVAPDRADADFYSIDPEPAVGDDDFEPAVSFYEYSGKWKPCVMQVMPEDEWWIDEDDPEMSDPESWIYYIEVSGTNGMAKLVLHYQLGNALPEGIVDRPYELSVQPSLEPVESPVRTFVDGEFSYCFSMSGLLSGRRYLLATEGGSAENPYLLGFESAGKVTSYEPWASEGNDARSFDPDSGGEGIFMISETAEDPTATCSLRYCLLPDRTIEEHDPLDLKVGSEGRKFVPGRINATDNRFYDTIIDQQLFRVAVTPGERYVVETTGARTNLLMRVYDKNGKKLYERKKKGDGSSDVRCGFTAPQAGVVYVGVCQDLKDDDLDEVLGEEVTITVEKVVPQNGEPDAADAADDTEAGATFLVAHPMLDWQYPDDVDVGTDAHRLGKNDWEDIFALPVRKGLVYCLVLTKDEPSHAETSVGVSLYFLNSNGKPGNSVRYAGNLESVGNPLTFEADRNGICYVKLSVQTGDGLDYPCADCPGYRIHTGVRSSTGASLGLLHVDAKGCESATWSLNSEALQYKLGMTLALPAVAKAYLVKYKSVTGFKADPTSVSVPVVAGVTNEAYSVYSDKYDPKDDKESGAFSWSLSNKEKTESRTLWIEDAADYFALTGKDGYYYDIVMKQSEGGDAVFSILHDGETLCSGVTEVRQFVLPTAKTKYYLKVQHKDPENPKDASYSLTGFYKNVGAIKFAKAEYKVKEGAASVTLAVNRTAKDGKVRVRLQTVDGAYAMGIDRGDAGDADSKFYRKDLFLEWGDGDNKAKSVTIDLIPDLRPLFHDVVRAFTVELVDAKDGDDSFYPASFVGGGEKAVTTVTLTEVAKKAPGTVQVANSDNKNAKKPEFTVTAGSVLTIKLDRTVGSYGDISVACDTSALDGTASNLLWQAGNAAPQELSVQVPEAKDRKASAKYTIKLKANTGSGLEKATLAASSITIYALNQQFAQTLADYTKKTLSKTAGYTVKEGKSGTWFVDENGDFVNFDGLSALTFSVTGPAVLQYRVDDGDPQAFVSAIPGKTAALTIPAGAHKVSDVKYVYNSGDFETVYQAVQYGYAEPISTDTSAKLKVALGKLPNGVKLEQDKTSKAWYVRGVPTKAGYFFAEIQDAQKNVIGTNAFEVIALRSAVGTFSGVAKAEIDGAAALAQVTFTAAATGKLSAKASVNGKSYSLAATGFVCADTNETPVRLDAELLQVQKGVTNKLTCTLTDYELADSVGWGDLPSCQLTMGGTPDTVYNGFLCRDNSKVTEWVTEMAGFAGYYTVALVPGDDKLGNGYLTLTLDAKGKIKIAGVRADGVSFSASSIVGGLDLTHGDPAVFVPVFAFKKPAVVGGWMSIRFPADGEPVTDVPAGGFFRWTGDDVSQALETVGGYYDTVVNLQRAYLTDAFSLSAVDVAVDVIGNTVSVPKGNAANVKLTFKRATGILTGTSDLEYGGKAYKNLKHAGILILNRSAANAAALDEGVWAAGSLVIPKVTNMPFNVLREQYEN